LTTVIEESIVTAESYEKFSMHYHYYRYAPSNF